MAMSEMDYMSGGGGSAKGIEGTYDSTNHSVSFSWDYDAVSYILVYRWSNSSDRVIAYGEIGSDSRKLATKTLTWFTEATWTSANMGFTSTSRSLSVTHPSNNFADAYVIPLTNTLTIS